MKIELKNSKTWQYQSLYFFGFHTPCIDFIIIIIIIIIIITASTFFLGVYKRGEIVCKFIYQILIRRRGIVMRGRTYVVYEFRTLPLLEKRISASYRSTRFLGI